MGRLAAALQPNASIVADCLVLKVDLIISSNCPLRILQITTRHEVSRILEQCLVQIPEIPSGDENSIHIENLLLLTCTGDLTEVQWALIANVQADSVLNHRAVLDSCDPAIRQNVVWPLLLSFARVAVPDALKVEGLVDMFEEVDAYDTVICAFVLGEGLGAEDGIAVVCYFGARWVEDLVDTEMN